MPTREVEKTIDIENAGNTVAVETLGGTLASLHISGDGAAEYQWDAKRRNGSWIQDIGPEYTGQSDYDDVVETVAYEIRIRCSSGTGTVDDTATITIMVGG